MWRREGAVVHLWVLFSFFFCIDLLGGGCWLEYVSQLYHGVFSVEVKWRRGCYPEIACWC